MKRRVALCAACAQVLAQCLPGAWAQATPAGVRRLAVLEQSAQDIETQGFFEAMARVGWVDGRNIVYDRASASDRRELLPQLAAELVSRKPDLIYAPLVAAALAVKRATATIPIVFSGVADPVRAGLVSSLAQPGGNVTGISVSFESLAPKRLELLRELMPRARHVGLLTGSPQGETSVVEQALQSTAGTLGFKVTAVGATNPDELDRAIADLAAARADAIMAASALAFGMRAHLIELATQYRLPVVGSTTPMAESGALFSYGAVIRGTTQLARMIDRLLKGARPADIPVQQNRELELVINLRTAKNLGIAVPTAIALRAQRVIE